jgi:hypothetical protein
MDFDKKQNTEVLALMIECLNRSESASSFCKSVVHRVLSSELAFATHLLYLTSESRLNLLGSYGYSTKDANELETSILAQNSASEAIRTGHFQIVDVPKIFDERYEAQRVQIPVMHLGSPIGVLGVDVNAAHRGYFKDENLVVSAL